MILHFIQSIIVLGVINIKAAVSRKCQIPVEVVSATALSTTAVESSKIFLLSES